MATGGDAGVGQAFQQLAREMANVSSALSAQGISQIVHTFDGNPKNFRDWIKQIDKYCKLTNANEDRKKLVAYSVKVWGQYVPIYNDI